MILQCRQIHKSYSNGENRLVVLKDISLEMNEGEIVCIMGSSGAGKSTLLNILGTLDTPDSGTVFIRGRDVSKLSEEETALLRNNDLGFVFQFHHLLPEFTAIENTLLPSMISQRSQSNQSRVKEFFDFMGLSKRLNHYPSQLSGGERQRVAVIRALIQSPSLVLADEPTGNLDKENENNLLNLIIQISSEFRQSFLIATHEPNIAKIAHRAYCLTSSGLDVMDNL
ncbi:MAG: lipoprotein-releasing system ATP-binding protein LolD [Candidatus Marinimicrobia bacterium]|nr:lipoprotein-releasing system ATP-binding protein LolD [Candidatus Neomarinimicrobiota bacterium]|tara:strand:+ start:687 stop:1364 length:678 start_codon:yes stop_codon:yes gene_type:complete